MTFGSVIDHLVTVLIALIPVGIAWNSTRRENQRMHRENQDRLITIETRVEPLWRWYNRYDNGRDKQ